MGRRGIVKGRYSEFCKVQHWGLFGFILLIAMSPVNAETTCEEEPFETHRAWVDDVEKADYFFWKRFLYRLDNPVEFPMPNSFYNPSEMVLGEPGHPMIRRSPKQRHLNEETLQSLNKYALPRKTGALIVAHDGEIDYEVYSGDFHAGSLLAIRSISKSLVGLLVGIAISDGDIESIDDPVGKYIDQWADDPRGEITIKSFLEMATGLENVRLELTPENKMIRLAEGANVHETALSYKLSGDDPSWDVNHVDSQILGMVVEQATGKRFGVYLSEKIWRPMGLDTATLNLDGKNGNARTFCCMRARGSDLVKIGQMLVDGGQWDGRQIVPTEWIKAMVQPSKTNSEFGLHTFIGWSQTSSAPGILSAFLKQSEPYKANEVFYFLGGHSIILWMFPEENLVVLRWGEDPDDWDPERIPNTILEGLQQERN